MPPKVPETDEAAVRRYVETLPPAAIAQLPSPLRRLVNVDPAVEAWEAGKAERDAAIAAATDPETGLYVEGGAELVAAAKAKWAALKAELTAKGN